MFKSITLAFFAIQKNLKKKKNNTHQKISM